MNFEIRTKQVTRTLPDGMYFKEFSSDEQNTLKQNIQNNYTRFFVCYQNIATILEKIIRGDHYKNGVLMFTGGCLDIAPKPTNLFFKWISKDIFLIKFWNK